MVQNENALLKKEVSNLHTRVVSLETRCEAQDQENPTNSLILLNDWAESPNESVQIKTKSCVNDVRWTMSDEWCQYKWHGHCQIASVALTGTIDRPSLGLSLSNSILHHWKARFWMLIEKSETFHQLTSLVPYSSMKISLIHVVLCMPDVGI